MAVMIANTGLEDGAAWVEVFALETNGSVAEDVVLTVGEGDNRRGAADESKWRAGSIDIGAVDYWDGFVVWMAPVNGRFEPWQLRVRCVRV